MTSEPDPIAAVSAAMRRRLDRLPRTSAARREFLQTYQRTTDAVGAAVRDGTFDDPEWVQRWDVAFALQRARIAGPEVYAARLAELEELGAARIAGLRAPGQVLLRLAVSGFGVVLPPEHRARYYTTRSSGGRRRSSGPSSR